MGNRSVIEITSENLSQPISLYGHWSGEDNLIAVQSCLRAADARIGDPAYLTAQLFHKFAVELGHYDGNLGFGIDVGSYDKDWLDQPSVYVNADTGNYTFDGITYDRAGVPVV